jgi:nucleotide-binding universal stress UspA family protein
MKKLLIGYDGSTQAGAALEDLRWAGLPDELDVIVLSVADVWLPTPHEQIPPPPPAPRAIEKARAQALQAVAAARNVAENGCDQLRKAFPHWRLQPEATADSPAWAIVKKSDDWLADLVAVGTHSRSALEALFLGSVAQKVVAEVRCSVRVMRPRRRKENEPLRLLIAVDGSEDSQRAVCAVAERNWPSGTEFCLLAVTDAKLQTAVAWTSEEALEWAEGAQSSEEWTTRMLQHSASKLQEAGFQVQSRTVAGEPKQVLLTESQAWGADCIFLGARGLHHGRRRFLGTLASAVAGRAHCSVEVVRSGA